MYLKLLSDKHPHLLLNHAAQEGGQTSTTAMRPPAEQMIPRRNDVEEPSSSVSMSIQDIKMQLCDMKMEIHQLKMKIVEMLGVARFL
ncbi:hypothetical protein C2845_PM05G19410 [Panicum miliaceum]|uniref:Uncharacterized protein n=1 Tax=Panicum miliaceum TaxID=4540 RepID=A0A3L6T031_PANMI|nr:hypothetical protein C2845_PM05G19410 [Panicum miliaceum]